MTGVRLAFVAPGEPKPQGSKNVGRNGRLYEASRDLAPWRESVAWRARQAMSAASWVKVHAGRPIRLGADFYAERPQSHYRRRLTSGVARLELRDDAPIWCTSTPDLDKLLRAIGDALTAAGVWHDDAQVVRIDAAHYYATATMGPCVAIEVTPL